MKMRIAIESGVFFTDCSGGVCNKLFYSCAIDKGNCFAVSY